MDDNFFDYESNSECRKCSTPCRYTRPRDPAYARVAVCCSSLNLLASALFRSWSADVEDGLHSAEMTRWLVEVARVFAPASLTVTHLLKIAIEQMNPGALLELQRHTYSMRHTNQVALASTLLQAIHSSLHQGTSFARVQRVLEIFIEMMSPSERVMHGLVLNVLSFNCCVSNADEHRSMVETVLGKKRRDWWATLDGGIACALRWARSPSGLIRAFQSRGMQSVALPAWEFESLFSGSAICHQGVQFSRPFVANRCVETSGLSVPLAQVPFHLHAILFSRVSKLEFAEFRRCADLLHREDAPMPDTERRRAVETLLQTLFGAVTSLELADRVLGCIEHLFPCALLPYVPPFETMGVDQPVLIQLALIRRGVSARQSRLCMTLTGEAFVEIRLKIALTLALAGAQIEPPEACHNRWLVQVASDSEADAVSRFVALCENGDNGPPFPQCPTFAALALRSLLLYRMGTPDPRLPTIMRRLRFSRAAELGDLWTSPFRCCSYHRYPTSCKSAIAAVLLALHRRRDPPRLPPEILLHLFECAGGPLHLGRCLGPWDMGEDFPLSSVELGVHDLGRYVVRQRNDGA